MQLSALDATAQAELVRTGQVSAAELVDAAIRRIERHDRELGSVIHPMFEEARTAARTATGPFAGVPIVVKNILSGARPNSHLVAALRNAGFVIVGKTQLSELAILPTSPTRNPWDPTRSTGGSSGGTGAAVAAGLVPLGHGTDTGGSIRIPSSCCGLVGLKPSRARISLGPDLSEVYGGLVTEGVLTRSVRDSAALLDVLHGPRPGDPYAAPPPARPYREEVGAPTGKLRVRWSATPSHPACVAAVANAADLLASLGHDVAEGELPAVSHPELSPRFLAVWSAGIAADLDHLGVITGRSITPEDVEPATWAIAQMGRAVPAAAYVAAWDFLRARGREAAAWFETHDLWLTPTITAPPVPLDHFASTPKDPLTAFFRAAELTPFTTPWNAFGNPAISLPVHITPNGLPVGVQLVTAYGREDLLLRVAAQVEQARPWEHRATRPN